MRCSASDARDSIPCHISDLLLISTGAVDTRGPSSCAKPGCRSTANGTSRSTTTRSAAVRAMCCGTARSPCPFAPETPASGVGDTGFYQACWYRREFALVRPTDGGRILLHFGAVDHRATVWVNGAACGEHEGGYTPVRLRHHRSARGRARCSRSSCAPTTIRPTSPSRAASRTGNSSRIRSGIPARPASGRRSGSSGCPPTWIRSLRWTPNLERWEIGLEASRGRPGPRAAAPVRAAPRRRDAHCRRHLRRGRAASVHRRIALVRPGYRRLPQRAALEPALAHPDQAELELWGDRGELLDSVESYTALRAVAVQGDRFVLNGRPFFAAPGARPGLLAGHRPHGAR